jgi:hypothetical protein
MAELGTVRIGWQCALPVLGHTTISGVVTGVPMAVSKVAWSSAAR